MKSIVFSQSPILTISLFLLALCSPLLAQKPNIIYIINDDLGYGDISCYGQKNFNTPHIDQLATNGIRFTRHYSGSTVCSPSRCSLMTGKDTGHAAIRGNGPFALPDEEITVAEIAKSAGYNTAMIGKSCVTGNTQTPETVLRSGFDFFFGTTDHKDGHFRYPEFVYRNTEKVLFPENKLHSGTDYDAELYTKETLDYLSKQSSETPFLLILSYPIPHASNLARDEELKAVRPLVKDEVVSSKQNRYTETNEVKAHYMGMMKYIDDSVGEIVASLKKQNLLDDTLIIFTSDNGPSTEGGYRPEFLGSNLPLRGSKRDLYEGGIRVPFIASWPASIKPKQTTDHPSAFWDFLPTVCDLIGKPIPQNIQGISFANTLLGKGDQPKHPHLYWEFHEQNINRAIQVGDWKLVQTNIALPDKTVTELFDIGKDIGETTNLADKHPEKTAELLNLIEKARVPNKNFPVPALDKPQQ
jgi:arylsulfatase A-like enzyme